MNYETQANVEYFYRLVYNCINGSCYGSVDASQFTAFLAHLWLWVTAVGYALSVVALIVIVYSIMRLFELRKREGEYYGELLLAPEEEGGINPRWLHIESLSSGSSSSEWRQAIIEADIMLDDMLTKQGYVGESIGEKLRAVEPSDFNTLNDAWEAHKVRNQIAHQGSAFDLSDTLAQRTIARYEAVFREFGML